MNFNEFKSELIETILLIKSGIQKIMDPIAKSENLTAIQLYVLFCVYKGKINTVGGFSKDFGVNQGNVSTICKDLEKMGLITRMRNSSDERVVNITITSKGGRIIERVDKKLDTVNHEKFKSLSKEKAEIIVNGFKEFGELIKNYERKGEE